MSHYHSEQSRTVVDDCISILPYENDHPHACSPRRRKFAANEISPANCQNKQREKRGLRSAHSPFCPLHIPKITTPTHESSLRSQGHFRHFIRTNRDFSPSNGDMEKTKRRTETGNVTRAEPSRAGSFGPRSLRCRHGETARHPRLARQLRPPGDVTVPTHAAHASVDNRPTPSPFHLPSFRPSVLSLSLALSSSFIFPAIEEAEAATAAAAAARPSLPIREDCWSEGATSTLIEAWGSRYLDLNRGNLRQKHWQEVADAVNARHGTNKKQRRTDVQCKNRIDTLKKKYKIEKAKLSSSSSSADGNLASQWPFFARLEALIGPAAAMKKPSPSPPPPLALPLPYRKTAPLLLPPAAAILPVKEKRSASVAGVDDAFFRRNYNAAAAAAAAADADSGSSRSSTESGRRDEEDEYDGDDDADGFQELAQAIVRFGEIYERVEAAKQRQMIELEKQRMEFVKGLEFQRMQLFMDSQVQLEKIKRAKRAAAKGECHLFSFPTVSAAAIQFFNSLRSVLLLNTAMEMDDDATCATLIEHVRGFLSCNATGVGAKGGRKLVILDILPPSCNFADKMGFEVGFRTVGSYWFCIRLGLWIVDGMLLIGRYFGGKQLMMMMKIFWWETTYDDDDACFRRPVLSVNCVAMSLIPVQVGVLLSPYLYPVFGGEETRTSCFWREAKDKEGGREGGIRTLSRGELAKQKKEAVESATGAYASGSDYFEISKVTRVKSQGICKNGGVLARMGLANSKQGYMDLPHPILSELSGRAVIFWATEPSDEGSFDR
ncbi:hypothetical protein ACLOJK_008795 [Asimina triloba]